VKSCRIHSNAASDADIEAAIDWYESEQPGLGLEFLDELRAAYLRILDGPLKYAVLRSGIRRALTRRFPYGVYFSIEDDIILIIAVLHTARDPAEWQFRI
jgi:plasmid stabilization system protein ParE